MADIKTIKDEDLKIASGGDNKDILIVQKNDACHFDPSRWQCRQVFGPGTSLSGTPTCQSCRFSKLASGGVVCDYPNTHDNAMVY